MAWSQSFSPNNLIPGFRKCGIYPFNHNAIEIIEYDTVTAPQLESTAIPTSSSSQGNPASSDQDSGSQESQDGTPNDDDTTTTLTEEMVDKFKRRGATYVIQYIRNGLVSNSVVALLSDIPALTPVAATNVEQLASNKQSLGNSPTDVVRSSLQSETPAIENNIVTPNPSMFLQKLITPVNPKTSDPMLLQQQEY